ncbi:MAG: hypothetical protein M1834_006772 [Cirrosporium novae-zelandiae]|nr:MAG: hypothetical protein M1834_006772 [Cirrosporium novae-zelandiae]
MDNALSLIMQVPLKVAVPAAVATAAYINARISVWNDLRLVNGLFRGLCNTLYTEFRDRQNIFYTLEDYATSKRFADKECFVYEGQSWTFKQLYETVLKYGRWLRTEYSVEPKEIVALDFTNRPDFVFCWFGLWSIGAVPAFINYNLTGHSLLHCIRTSTARLLIVDPEVREKITTEVQNELASSSFRNDEGSVQVVFMEKETQEAIMKLEPARGPDSLRAGALANDMGCLIYTSGTTGMPKAANVAWGKFRVAGVFVVNWMGLKATDRFYTCMPLYHSTACILGFTACLLNGIPIILGHKFSTTTFWPEVRSSHATVIQYVGETCRYLLSAPPHPLDGQNDVRIGYGNGLRPDIWAQFQSRFNIPVIAETYAATEGTLGVFNLCANEFTQGAIGRNGKMAELVLGNLLSVVRLDEAMEAPRRYPEHGNFCQRAKDNEPGELLFRLPGSNPETIKRRFQGYFNNPEASQEKVLFNVFRKGDAFFRTGDVIRWDDQGRMFFCDRIGDTFRWKSENVATTEVEAALGAFPAVKQCTVYGVEVPKHEGRAGCAALVMNSASSEDNTMKELATHLQHELPKYAVPLFLRVTAKEALDTTGNHKFVKHDLRQEGVDPDVIEGKSGDRIFWLHEGRYIRLDKEAWEQIKSGGARL